MTPLPSSPPTRTTAPATRITLNRRVTARLETILSSVLWPSPAKQKSTARRRWQRRSAAVSRWQSAENDHPRSLVFQSLSPSIQHRPRRPHSFFPPLTGEPNCGGKPPPVYSLFFGSPCHSVSLSLPFLGAGNNDQPRDR